MIDFKTYDEQIAVLDSKGLIINDIEKTKKLLVQNNYYNVINGYFEGWDKIISV